MTRKTFYNDQRGASVVEFALTLPVFLLMLLGVWQISFGMWAQFALQHGAEMAARCMNVSPAVCGTTTITSTQNYAAAQSYGLNPSPSVFTVSTPTCGYQISAAYTVSPIMTGIPALTVHAQACYAINPNRLT
ncbi:MAG TPA: TadE family protein [Methylocella sp.]|nr:TadE family protein [Methylocella sp.]